MNRWSNEKEAKEEILKLVEQYYHDFKEPRKSFEPGDRINYASRVYDEKEMVNLVDSALEFWLTSGRYTNKNKKSFAPIQWKPQSQLQHLINNDVFTNGKLICKYKPGANDFDAIAPNDLIRATEATVTDLEL